MTERMRWLFMAYIYAYDINEQKGKVYEGCSQPIYIRC
jgi:hypothetical protein